MGVMKRVVKPKTKRSLRALEAREPKVIENTKTALFIRGTKTNEKLVRVLKDVCALKKPYSQMYSKKNDIRPFENYSPLELLSQRADASLFLLANHNKKRPDNLIFGRMYDYHLLDMIEVGVTNFKSLQDFKNEKIPMGTKPCLFFSGSRFRDSPELARMKSLMIDFFRGPEVTNIRLSGLELAIQFTAVEDDKMLMRTYKIHLKKSGTRLPRVELEEIGPSMDLKLRRTHLASDELTKEAQRIVKNVHKPKKVKNIEKDDLDTTLGRVHVPAQNISKIQTRKMKGLKETPEEKKVKKAEGKKERRNLVESVFMEED